MFFHFIPFTTISDYFSLFLFLFPRYTSKYIIVPGDCDIFCFICLCNEDYDRKTILNTYQLQKSILQNLNITPINQNKSIKIKKSIRPA